jgi:hypothetical protein
MKKTLGLVALVAVVAAGVSFAVARWAARPPVTAAQLHDAAWLKHELNLTGPQAGEVAKLQAELQKQLTALCGTHCAARFALGDELMKSGVDTTKCASCVERMNTAQAEAERVTLAHILKVRALLTDQQAQRYGQIIHDQVCTMPMGAP